jgi:hypothetical protein
MLLSVILLDYLQIQQVFTRFKGIRTVSAESILITMESNWIQMLLLGLTSVTRILWSRW